MAKRRFVLAALLTLPFAASAQQPATPQMFVENIYQPYRQKGFKGQPYEQTARFFTVDLARAIDADFAQAKRKNEVPTLDGDPFIDAQDGDVAALSITSSVAGDKATAAVAFLNSGEPKAMALTLARTPQGWRIHDIVGANGSLRALYKLRP